MHCTRQLRSLATTLVTNSNFLTGNFKGGSAKFRSVTVAAKDCFFAPNDLGVYLPAVKGRLEEKPPESEVCGGTFSLFSSSNLREDLAGVLRRCTFRSCKHRNIAERQILGLRQIQLQFYQNHAKANDLWQHWEFHLLIPI